jgi:rubrerythrin
MLPADFTEPNFEAEAAASEVAAVRLWRQSQERRWEVDELPWQLGVKLDARQKAGAKRILSQILFGEQATLQIIEQILPKISGGAAALFLQSQAQDEARHVEVFTRYLDLLGKIEPPGPSFAQMVAEVLDLELLEAKLICTHILIEEMALETFHAIALQIDDPLLREIMRRVFRDESRHVAFGATYARQLVAGLDQVGRDEVARWGGRWAVLAAGLIREEQASAAEFGLDLRVVQARTQRVLIRRLSQIGLLDTLGLF